MLETLDYCSKQTSQSICTHDDGLRDWIYYQRVQTENKAGRISTWQLNIFYSSCHAIIFVWGQPVASLSQSRRGGRVSGAFSFSNAMMYNNLFPTDKTRWCSSVEELHVSRWWAPEAISLVLAPLPASFFSSGAHQYWPKGSFWLKGSLLPRWSGCSPFL